MLETVCEICRLVRHLGTNRSIEMEYSIVWDNTEERNNNCYEHTGYRCRHQSKRVAVNVWYRHSMRNI